MKYVKLFVMVLGVCILASCGNKQLFDTTQTFNYAIIKNPDGSTVSGKVVSWKDYSDGDQLQVEMDDGIVYLVHASNITLMYK